MSAADEIAKFAALRDQGIITEVEFAMQKAKLLALDPVLTEPPRAGYDVVLLDAGRKKIEVIKRVREATGLGLKEAKDLVESAPAPVRTGLDSATAEALRRTLEAAGARVDVR